MTQEPPPGGDRDDSDPQALYEAIERAILGSPRSYTRRQAAEMAGVPMERAISLWRSLGFPGADDDDYLFLDADIEALRMVSWLVEVGFIDPTFEHTLARSMGLSFSRLAEWEVAEIATAALNGTRLNEPFGFEELISSLMPVVEDLQNYVWRRHLANAVGRTLLQPGGAERGSSMAVGFADIVGFTRRSRGLSTQQLSHLVEVFEGTAVNVVSENHGRIIKTLGDEVLFVADTPTDLARIALDLIDGQQFDEDFPDVRVGAAYGEVLTRMGDVFGPVVNVAARLTSLARPRRILVDRALAEALLGDREFRVRRGRTVAVKGYSRLETFTLKRPHAVDADEDIDEAVAEEMEA